MSGVILETEDYHVQSKPVDFRPISEHGKAVTEAEYWDYYYEGSDIKYEWVNGFLEEVGVSNYKNFIMYRWFLLLLELYIQKYDTGKIVFQEFGFRLELDEGNVSIRIPDIAVVAHDNLVALEDEDNRYNGVYDLCIELISDSYQDIKRDTKIKLREYEAVGVREYFILDAETNYMAFYRLNEFGIYERIKPIEGDIIQSEVLAGFHFRISDLLNTPSLQEIIEDPLYSSFAVPGYMKQKRRAELAEEKAERERQRAEQEKRRAEQEKQRAEQEKRRAEQEKQRAEQEKQRAEQEKQRAEQEKRLAEQEKQRAELAELKVEALSAKLRALGETL